MQTQSLVRSFFKLAAAWLVACLNCSLALAEDVATPEKFLGHAVGADYRLARWEKIVEYFRLVDEASDRVNVREFGRTTEGLPLIVTEIGSAETIRNLQRHREAQRRIADPRLIADEAEERRLATESRVVVLVNCNLHSTEVASSQMAIELLYDLATSDSPRVREILDRVIILLIPSANPDGLNKVIDWYNRSLGKPWEGSGMPWLYHKYAGHDNNRDWFMLALQETRHVTRLLYDDWFPTIVYDVHQMGNSGARLFVPPFHDPKNPNVHPRIDQSIMIIGGHIASELEREGKKGVVWGAIYDNWWEGGFRTTPYRHNMVGILTEAASPNIASPVFQKKSDLRGSTRGMPSYTQSTAFPDPWPGGWWRLRDVVEYEKIACMSLFTLAARYHEMFQGNYIKLGREAMERGRSEPPFAWLVPTDQRDPGVTAKMLEILYTTGIEVHRAEQQFTADGVEYPPGTHLLFCGQPYRAHLNDMMERQNYPDRSLYPGGPAEPPYDIAGWTLPLQMGVRAVAVAQPFDVKARKLERITAPQGELRGPSDSPHYWVVAGLNDDFRILNRLHVARIPASVTTAGRDWRLADGTDVPPGSIVIQDAAKLRAAMPKLLDGLAVSPIGHQEIDGRIRAVLQDARPPRLGLYQPWSPSMDEGWTRLVLETHEFPYTSVHNANIRAGNLHDRYDCLILPSIGPRTILDGQAADATEPEYVGGLGREGVISLQDFVHSGGTLVCLDDSCDFAIEQFNLPVKNIVKGKKTEDFYCPGSILRVAVDRNHPIGFGVPAWVSAYFARSQAFEIEERGDRSKDSHSAVARMSATVVARYSDTVLLESGWIRGGDLIADKPAIIEVSYGTGHVVLIGFAVQHRAQPHGTFRLLFNAIQRNTSGAEKN